MKSNSQAEIQIQKHKLIEMSLLYFKKHQYETKAFFFIFCKFLSKVIEFIRFCFCQKCHEKNLTHAPYFTK